jgi:glycosyltransferase involved in cell wall biosynthesis
MADRIVIVTGSLQVGGAERQIAQIVPRLDRDRWHVDILTLSQPGPLADELERVGFRVFSPPLVNRIAKTGPLIRLLRAIITIPWLWFWFLRNRPDIAHFVLPEAYLIGGLCALLAGQKRMIMSRRSLAHYQERHPLLSKVERFLHPRMSVIIANSEAIRRDLVRERAPNKRLWVIRNGVNTEAFRPDHTRGTALREELEIGPDVLVLVIVANLIPYKGHADLIDALARIDPDLPDGWQLLCVGRDDGVGAALVAQSETRGLSGNVRFLGSRTDIPDLLNAADISLLCSHEEGLPNAIIEAMSCGTAVVSTEVGGTGELIDDGINGILVPPGDPAALSRSILELSRDTKRRHTMGQAARTEIERAYDLETCARAYDDIYRLVMASDLKAKR